MLDKVFNKSIVADKKGNVFIDLIEPSFNSMFDYLQISNVQNVGEFEGRIDLFAKMYGYGTDDIVPILKFNRIQNPFNIGKDHYLAVPNFSAVKGIEITPEKRNVVNKNRNDIRDTFFNSMTPFKKSGVVNNTFESFKKKYENLEQERKIEEFKNLQNSSGTDTGLFPPNINDDITKNDIKVNSNGTITMGTSVADTESSCGKKTLTKAELLNSLIKNRR
jgi:hypothetical protein